MSNIRIARNDILANSQCRLKRCDYVLDNMVASSDLGYTRSNQQDSVLITTHPNVEDFSLLAVADGMGGLKQGEIASNLALLLILEWFEKLSSDFYDQDSSFLEKINLEIDSIDAAIRSECFNAGTTLSLALVLKDKTLLANVGDSRIYTSLGKNFRQVTEDHSICWDLYKNGFIRNKSDMIFHRQKNLINSKLGGTRKNLMIFNKVLENRLYDRLVLATDGITDILTDDEIFSVIQRSSPIIPTRRLINKALGTKKINTFLDSEFYYDSAYGGTDNLSAAILTKNRKW